MGGFKLESLCALRACSFKFIEHNFGGGVAKCHRYNHMTDIPGTFILADWGKTCRESSVLLD